MSHLLWRVCVNLDRDVPAGLQGRVIVCLAVCMHARLPIHVHVYVTWAHVCVCGCSVFCQVGGVEGSALFPWIGSFVAQCLWESGLTHVLVFLTAVLPTAVTKLKNLGPCGCSETVQRQISRIRGHFAIPTH